MFIKEGPVAVRLLYTQNSIGLKVFMDKFYFSFHLGHITGAEQPVCIP